ncbi:aminotransferase class-iii [Photorhabdus temperata]|uniref:4-aminobutyrate aminotransferase family protein n=1 Tax=Photorhabdus khanii NC19 TaxID=1004151 RepID=W3V6C9_9GAMM|nr:aminotransferase class III-fold pyridoxal phosphate-dependent enzyme [Photorhabdus khanii]ETS31363.1 4-aminobutyrate aminotransferase family protein [Photorhabdus khanii NC19]OHV50953.1 aminotransferase class-iii [Photorhabdus temperata]
MFVNQYRESLLNSVGLELDIKSAENNRLTLSDGRVVKDFLAQYGALPFGHNPDFAITEVSKFIENKEPIFFQPNIHKKVRLLAEMLAEQIDKEKYTHCTFTNSGAETVEAGIKFARLVTGRKSILSLNRSFHGKTYSALSATGSNRFKADFIYDDKLYEHVDSENLDEIKRKLESREFAAFIIEPVQGEGGMKVIPSDTLSSILQLCKANGTLSVFDEVQTGIGRLGAFCAATLYSLKPDVILFSKALGAGISPIGAMLYSDELYVSEFDKKHSSTFANNVLAATMGIAVIEHLTKDDGKALTHVQEVSNYVDECLEQLAAKYPTLFYWQGAGLMRGLEIQDSKAVSNIFINFSQRSGGLAYIICSFLLKHYGIFTMPLMSRPCSVRFEPPLNVAKEDIKAFFTAFDEVCKLVQNGRYDILFSHLIDLSVADLPPPSVSYPISRNNNVAQIKTPVPQLIEGKKFAFLIHTTSVNELAHSYCLSIKENYTPEQQKQLGNWITEVSAIDFNPDIAVEFGVESSTAYANGMLLFSPISPEDMMALSVKERAVLMKEYFDIAEKNGAEIVGLGAYTSVITDGGNSLVNNRQGRIVTNGNSLTAMAVVEGIRSMLAENASQQTLAVVGARGSVGRLSVTGLAHNFGRIILVSRPNKARILLSELTKALLSTVLKTHDIIQPDSVMDKMRKWLVKQNPGVTDARVLHQQVLEVIGTFGLEAIESYEQSLSQADFIVSATSEGKPFLNTNYLKDSAIVFDAARPFDFIRDGNHLVYEGGLVYQPEKVTYSDCNLIDVPAGVNLACLSETIAVALEQVSVHQSIGKSIDYNDALAIRDIARKHGFIPVQYAPKNQGERYEYVA